MALSMAMHRPRTSCARHRGLPQRRGDGKPVRARSRSRGRLAEGYPTCRRAYDQWRTKVFDLVDDRRFEDLVEQSRYGQRHAI